MIKKIKRYIRARIANVVKNETEAQTEKLHSFISTLNNDISARLNSLASHVADLKSGQNLLAEELHEHLDTTQRDLLIVLNKIFEFAKNKDIILQTDFPLALDSPDYLHPNSGNRVDYSRSPRFIRACEDSLKKKQLSFLDLGCAGGGIVFDAVLRGHKAIGLEGCDFSYLSQRADWRLLQDNLFTCDIAKPFTLLDKETGKPALFDVITAFEVLEHIQEEDLEVLFANVSRHMAPGSIFVASISKIADGGSLEDGRPLHQTIKPFSWWENLLKKYNLLPASNLIAPEDFARGYGNRSLFWSASSYAEKPGDCYLATFVKSAS